MGIKFTTVVWRKSYIFSVSIQLYFILFFSATITYNSKRFRNLVFKFFLQIRSNFTGLLHNICSHFFFHLRITRNVLVWYPLYIKFKFVAGNFCKIFHQSWYHCGSVQLRSFFWIVFSRISTEYGEIRSIFWMSTS